MKKYGPIKDEQANLLTIRDPMILPVGDTYFMTGTQPPYWKEANDGVHLWSTKDLRHFEDRGLIIRRADMPEDMWCRDRFWAPELFDGGNGWFYLTFNCRNSSERYPHPHNVALARSRNIEGPYEIVTPDKALPEPDFTDCNDATMFRDDDGSIWIAFNNTPRWLTLHCFDPDTLTISESMRVAEKGKEGEWDFAGVEGQCIVKRHHRYFMWYSSWTNGYNAGLLTATRYARKGRRGRSNKHRTGCRDRRIPYHHGRHGCGRGAPRIPSGRRAGRDRHRQTRAYRSHDPVVV